MKKVSNNCVNQFVLLQANKTIIKLKRKLFSPHQHRYCAITYRVMQRSAGNGIAYTVHPESKSSAIFEWGKFLTFKFHEFFVQTFLYVVPISFCKCCKKMIKTFWGIFIIENRENTFPHFQCVYIIHLDLQAPIRNLLYYGP